MIRPTLFTCPKMESLTEQIKDSHKVAGHIDTSKIMTFESDGLVPPHLEKLNQLRKINLLNMVPGGKAYFHEESRKYEFALQHHTNWFRIQSIPLVKGTDPGQALEKKYVYGVEESSARTFGLEIGLELSVSAGSEMVGMVQATVSTKFSESVTDTRTIAKSTETTYRPPAFIVAENGRFVLWQKESWFYLMYRKKDSGEGWMYMSGEPMIVKLDEVDYDMFPASVIKKD